MFFVLFWSGGTQKDNRMQMVGHRSQKHVTMAFEITKEQLKQQSSKCCFTTETTTENKQAEPEQCQTINKQHETKTMRVAIKQASENSKIRSSEDLGPSVV